MNKDIWGVIDTTSNVLSGTDNVEKFDTIVQRSTTQESNLELSRIEEESIKSVFPELGTKLDPIVQMNLAHSSKASVTQPFRQRIYGTSVTSALSDRRTVTGCGGERTEMIGWGIRMVLKI